MTCCWAHRAVAGVTTQPDQRVINFPSDLSLGVLKIDNNNGSAIPIGPARGTVKVTINPGQQLVLKLVGKVFLHPELIDSIKNAPIDKVEVSFMSVVDEERGLVDRVVERLPAVKALSQIYLEKADADDSAIAKLATLPKLSVLSCVFTQSHGKFLQAFAASPILSKLTIWNGRVDTANLQYLPRMSALSWLSFHATGLNLEGFKYIAQCKNVYYLRVSEPLVDDRCMALLKNHPLLSTLDLSGTKVTMGGIKALAPSHLKIIAVPVQIKDSDDAQIRKWIPNITIMHQRARALTADEEQYFSPLH